MLEERLKTLPTNEYQEKEYANAKALYDGLKASIAEMRTLQKELNIKK